MWLKGSACCQMVGLPGLWLMSLKRIQNNGQTHKKNKDIQVELFFNNDQNGFIFISGTAGIM